MTIALLALSVVSAKKVLQNPVLRGHVVLYGPAGSSATFDFAGSGDNWTPKTDSEDDIGSPSKRLKDVYADTLDASVRLKLAAAAFIDAGSSTVGTDTFTTTAQHDTVLISNVTANSVFVVSPNVARPDSFDFLTWTVSAGTLFVHRVSSQATSGLKYSYIRIE